KPMEPLTATMAPVSSAVAVNRPQRARDTCTPSAAAAVSPYANASKIPPKPHTATPSHSIAPTEMATADQSAPASDPKSQLRISRYESPVALQKITRDVNAPARDETARPARTVRVGVMMPRDLANSRVT